MAQHVPDISTMPIIRGLAKVLENNDRIASQIGRPNGGQRAKVVDVDDPLNRGRVRVIFDVLNNEEIPAVMGAGSTYSGPRQGQSQTSHWIDCSPAFRGRQPPSLVGKRVLVNTTDGELHYSVLADVLHDPEMLVSDAAERLPIPNSSTMVRFPPYPAGELPPPCEENVGCSVIELGGPMGSDWLCVCLKRNGKYFWVRHVDLSHAHAGGDDGIQPPSASGERQNPVYMGTTSSHVAPTTGIQHIPNSSFSQNPRGNPFGSACAQPLPPMSEISDPNLKFKELKDFDLLDPNPDVAVSYVREAAGYLPLNTSIAGFRAKYNPEIPLLYEPAAVEAFTKANKALTVLTTLGKVVGNPQQFITEQALSLAKGAAEGIGVPPGTKVSLEKLTASGNVLTKALGALSIPVTGVLDALRKVL